MILYFSATGNTKYIATELAKALCDNVLDLRALHVLHPELSCRSN